jgi:hypothetical protein
MFHGHGNAGTGYGGGNGIEDRLPEVEVIHPKKRLFKSGRGFLRVQGRLFSVKLA